MLKLSSDIQLEKDKVKIVGHLAVERPPSKAPKIAVPEDIFDLDDVNAKKSSSKHKIALVEGSTRGELIINNNNQYSGVIIDSPVVIRGRLLVKNDITKLTSWDLILDNPKRRTSKKGKRRAVVHGPKDTLVLNWGSDYPGGTSIHSDLNVKGNLSVSGMSGNLKVSDIEVVGRTSLPSKNNPPKREPGYNLRKKIKTLESRISSLEKKIDKLEKRK